MSILERIYAYNLIFQFIFIFTAALYGRLRSITAWADRRVRDRTPEEQRGAMLYPFVGTITGLIAAYGLTRLSDGAYTGILVIDLAILTGIAGGYVMLMPLKRLGRVDVWERAARSLLREDWAAATAKERQHGAQAARILGGAAERLCRRSAAVDFVPWLLRHRAMLIAMLLSLAPSAAAVPIWTLVPMLGKSPVSIRHWIGLALVLAGGVFMPFAARAAYQAHQRHRQRVFAAIGYEARWAGRRIDRRAGAIKYTIESGLKGSIGTAYFESITEKSSKMRPVDLSTAAGVGGNGPQAPTGN